MKQCHDRSLSPFTSPFPIGSSSSSSLPFVASESDPEDSFWRDFNFDFSFLTSEDHNTSPDVDNDDKVEESEMYGLKCVDSKSSPLLTVVSKSHFDLTMEERRRSQRFPSTESVLGVSSITPVAKSVVVANNGACSGTFLVRKESNCSPLLSKMSALGSNSSGVDILSEKLSKCIEQDDTELDSPCWRGTQSRDSAASGIKSLIKRSSDDVNGLYGLNPLAPQFIPFNAKNIDKNGSEFGENSSSSMEKSLSSTFPPLSGEFSIVDTSKARIEKRSDHEESLGLVSQDSVCNTMSILDINNECQKSRKLDPLAPVFVPACTKLSAVVHEKHGIAIEPNVHSTSALSSSENTLLDDVKVEKNALEVDHRIRNRYSNDVLEWGTTYSFNPQLQSRVQISETTKLDSFSNKAHGRKKLNPLAPQFSLAESKQKVYDCEENQAACDVPHMVNSSVLVSPIIGYRNHKELHAGLAQSSVHVEPSYKDIPPAHSLGLETAVSSSLSNVKALSDFGDRPGCSTSSSSSKMDVKKLLTTIHGLSELLAHVHSSEISDSPNEQYLDLINCTVQNLNSYINNRVQESIGNYATAVHGSCDISSFSDMHKQSIGDHQLPKARMTSANFDVKRKEKYSMISGDMLPESHFEFGVIGDHQTEEQINPQVLFYRSLWLKAKADRSLMEYKTFLSKTSNLNN